MSKHILSLNIPDTYNPRILTVLDESVYADSPKVTCERLEIMPPGYNVPTIIEVAKGFRLNLNACALGIQSKDCGDIQADLPDGVYVVRYAIAPLDKVFVEYNYLRITGLMNQYYLAFTQARLQPCSPSDSQVKTLKELRLIESFIQAAKVKVEFEHKAEEGLALLVYAKKRLDRLNKTCCN